jgi:hypothetical protein
LAGPINKLQNALSFNYYANAHVYDVRADYVKNGVLEEGLTSLSGYIKTETSETSLGTTPIEDQIAASEIESDGPANEPSETPSSSTEPKITGFSSIYITPTSDFLFSITIVAKQKGIVETSGGTTTFLLNETEFTEFVDKGVKIVIEAIDNPEYNDRNEFNLNEASVTGLVNGVGYVENDTSVGEGNYSVSIYYDGNKIQSVPVVFNNDEIYSRYY